MNVLHVINSAKFGGIEKVVYDILVEQLGDDDVVADIFITRPEGEFLGIYSELPVKLHLGVFNTAYDFSAKKIMRLSRLFAKYDIIHMHSFNLQIAVAALASGSKVIYTEHGNFARGRKVRLTDRFNHLFKKYFLKCYVSYITFNSYFSLNYARKRYSLDMENMQVVYNGVNPRFTRIPGENAVLRAELEGLFVVGTSSRFAGVKRIDRLIEGFDHFSKSYPDVRLLLVGDGPLMGDFKREVFQRGIEDKVTFTGFKENVADYQDLMSVCVFPSSGESFGLVAVEALLQGKPTIVFADGGGLVEIVGRGEKENVVADQSSFVNRLNYFYRKKDYLAVERQSRLATGEFFSVKKMTKELKKIYHSSA